MIQVHCSPDLRTIDLGKTRINHLSSVGHPGYGRTEKDSLYLTPEVKALKRQRAKDLGYSTENDYVNDLIVQDAKGHLPEVETQDSPEPHLDVTSEEVTPLPAGDPPREETPMPKGPWQERFWQEAHAITGESVPWLWLGEGYYPVIEYGQVIELTVPNKMTKDFILERELIDCVLTPALQKVGITKTMVIAVRCLTPEAPKAEASKPSKPIDPVIATLEEEIRAQKALDPRGTNEVVKGKISELTAQWYFRRRELKPPKQWQSHLALWRQSSGKRGASGFESTGPATRGDLREAERAMRKDSS